MIWNKSINRVGSAEKAEGRAKNIHPGAFIFLLLWSIYVLIPFYIMFILSIKTQHEANYTTFSWWVKEGITFSAYSKVFVNDFGGCTILSGFRNTLVYTIPTVVTGIFVGTMAAYSWAKLKWKGKKFIFPYMMARMMLPSCITMTSQYVMFSAINWVGTPLPLMVPGMFCGIAQIFFMKQFMTTIPNDLLDAAKADGLGAFGVFIKIVLPISLPAVFTQIIFCFISMYNDYLNPLLYLEDPELYTLQIALKFYSETYKNNTPVIMAGSLVAIMPTLIIFILAQDFILKGINIGSGLKF